MVSLCQIANYASCVKELGLSIFQYLGISYCKFIKLWQTQKKYILW